METAIDQVERPEWLTTQVYPFTLRRLDLSAGAVTYIDEGSGPTLLFVHAGMWSYVFRDLIADLSSDHRCVTLDFPGSGLSPAAEGVGELSDLAELLTEFVARLELEAVTVVLHDLGGLVGIGAAAGDTERYDGLVMINSFAWTPDKKPLRGMLRVMGGRVMTILDSIFNLVPRMTATSFGAGRHLDRPGRRALRGPFRSRGPRKRFHELMHSVLADSSFTDAVEQATIGSLSHLPVLSIYGERNDPFGFQDRVAATWAHHEGHVIKKGNHFPMCDDPARVADTIRTWHAENMH